MDVHLVPMDGHLLDIWMYIYWISMDVLSIHLEYINVLFRKRCLKFVGLINEILNPKYLYMRERVLKFEVKFEHYKHFVVLMEPMFL